MSNDHPYSELTPDRVMDAIEGEGFICDGRILPLNSYENRVYQVGIEDGDPVIAKFYRPQRWSLEQIQEEHDFTLQLESLEIPVVPPLQLNNGTTVGHCKPFYFALFCRRGGRSPDLDNDDNLEILGRCIGRIHSASGGAAFNYRPTLTPTSFGTESIQFLIQQQFIPDELIDAYSSLTNDLMAIVEQRFSETPFQNISLHGDLHPSNLLWRDDAPNFVDFDDARNGPAVQDLWMLLSGDRDQQQHQLQPLLSGYEEFCDFNSAELSLIEPLRTLRIINYSAWLARRWKDPAFPINFPWFNTTRYWSEHILTLREQLAALQEPPLRWFG